jgi:hypothetical protein
MASDITGLGPRCGHKTGDIFTVRHVLAETVPAYIYNHTARAEINYPANSRSLQHAARPGVLRVNFTAAFDTQGADCWDVTLCTLRNNAVSNSG